VARDAVTIEGEEHLTWYHSSDKVRRGFCSTCGASLFWEPTRKAGAIAIAMGAFDDPTHTRLGMHIFVADRGDYYEIADGLPQNQH
jgi:hypothetical protein